MNNRSWVEFAADWTPTVVFVVVLVLLLSYPAAVFAGIAGFAAAYLTLKPSGG